MQPSPDNPPIVPKVTHSAEGASLSARGFFRQAEFFTTAAEWAQLPDGGAREVAFAGRSNAGKSSAINALAQQTRLAYVSKTPGRTQNINFFHLRSGALLADLPGYGYAKVPEAMRKHWQQFLARYLAERQPLAGMVLVMDARHPFTDLDHRMLRWFLPSGRPLHILLTKADKLTHSEQLTTLKDARASLAQHYAIHAAQTGVQLFSAVRHVGLEETEVAVCDWLNRPLENKERPRHQGE
jgi:GTP-binding protein